MVGGEKVFLAAGFVLLFAASALAETADPALAAPGALQIQDDEAVIKSFLTEVKAGGVKGEPAAYLGAGLEPAVLHALAGVLAAYDFQVAKSYLVADDCLLKLRGGDDRQEAILTLRLGYRGEKWLLLQRPLLREVLKPAGGWSTTEARRVRRKSSELRTGILVEEAMLEGVEEFLLEMKDKYQPLSPSRPGE